MIANYYTLRHIARQLDQRLKGSPVSAVFSQNRNELIIGVDSSKGVGHPTAETYLIVSCEPSQNHIFLNESFARARRNSVDLFEQIVGQSIQSVSIPPADRQIVVTFEAGLRLMIQLFGSKANVVLVNDDEEIIDSFLRGKETRGTRLSSRSLREALPDRVLFLQQLRELGEISIGIGLKKFFPTFGVTLLAELIHRSGLVRSDTVDRLSDEEIAGLFDNADTMIRELESKCAPCIYYEHGNATTFSIIELHHRNNEEKREFDSLDEAIRTYIGASANVDRTAQEQTRIRQGVGKELVRITRTLEKITEETESAERARHYEEMGELLKAHLHELQKGMAEAILENTVDGTNEIIAIPLDRNLTPAKNAERYFEKAKRSRIAVAEKTKQATKLAEEKRLLEEMLRKIDTLVSLPEMEEFFGEYRDPLNMLGLVKKVQDKKKPKEEIPFRVFKVSGEFTVWAGKSSENNDLLSTRYTKANDLWFHARGAGGSHVVLKSGSGKGEISKHAIHEAAAIAAYYSKMKNAKLVPVAVCEGKYVRKPKGAPAGTVTIEREKVIFVEPRLPVS